jgi:hypothetical protein
VLTEPYFVRRPEPRGWRAPIGRVDGDPRRYGSNRAVNPV